MTEGADTTDAIQAEIMADQASVCISVKSLQPARHAMQLQSQLKAAVDTSFTSCLQLMPHHASCLQP